jgi:hypothetical protein
MNHGFQWVHELKKTLGKTIPELLALARNNDPFFAGSPTDWEQARWFSKRWEQLGFIGKTGIHLAAYALPARGCQTQKVERHAVREQLGRLE